MRPQAVIRARESEAKLRRRRLSFAQGSRLRGPARHRVKAALNTFLFRRIKVLKYFSRFRGVQAVIQIRLA